MFNPMSLDGKSVLVTGASSGIGRACAIYAAMLGARVVLTARRKAALEETLAGMERVDMHALIAGDITDAGFVEELVAQSGRLDGFVHAAGVGPMMPIGLIDSAFVESVLKTNYLAFLELMKHYSRRKNRADQFSAVAISSIAAFAGWGGVSVYSGSKGALSSSVRALAMELASKGMRVNAVCPSNIRTPMYDAGAGDMKDEASVKALINKQPLGLGEPDQVASVVCFLLGDASNFMTGVNLPVDGGYLAQ